MPRIDEQVIIDATPAAVWDALTNPESIARWMGEPQMRLEVITSWRVGEPIVISGVHHAAFQNRGTILCFDRERRLQFTHLSSVSRLPDEPQNYSVILFELAPAGSGTSLRVSVDNFPTETIFRHHAYYWRITVAVLKAFVEQHAAARDPLSARRSTGQSGVG